MTRGDLRGPQTFQSSIEKSKQEKFRLTQTLRIIIMFNFGSYLDDRQIGFDNA